MKKILDAIVNGGAQTLNDIKSLVPDVRRPGPKVSTLTQSGHITVGEDGHLEATSKGEKAVS
ncbi:MAG: hypothetical protein WCV86_05255 [Patescibacteria group bacterium]